MKKVFLFFVSLLMMTVFFSGCDQIPIPTKPVETEPPVEQIAASVTAEDLLSFDERFPYLKEADLRGSTCYDAIQDYIALHPDVKVTYTVTIGAEEVSPSETDLTLLPGQYELSVLSDNLRFLRNVKSVLFRNTDLSIEAIEGLSNRYPDIDFSYTVPFCGAELDSKLETLDLSAQEPAVVLNQTENLKKLPALHEIYLMTDTEESLYTLEDAAALQQILPDAFLHYSFELFGQRVSSTDNEIVFANKYIGNQEGALDTLHMALTVLRGCTRFVLDNCHFSNESLAELRDEFRETTNIVWRVWFGDGGCLTDREVIRHVYGLYDYNSANLVYCEGAQFIDFGHNEILRQCDFVAGMPNLKAIILSGSMVSDLTPFQNCPNLEFLEIAYCGYVEDISPLAACTNLKRLNIAYTKVDDLTALDQLNLDVLVDARSKVDAEDWAHFESLHPDCIVQHTGDARDDQPYGYPWRYEPNGDPNEYYALLKEKFHYPNPSNTLY